MSPDLEDFLMGAALAFLAGLLTAAFTAVLLGLDFS